MGKPLMMPLQIPVGCKCSCCMFLEIDYNPDVAKCKLFDEVLTSKWKYGAIAEETIEKSDRCPRHMGGRY